MGEQMYKSIDICAVIVTYNCDENINDNINSLLKQVSEVLIIDNDSQKEGKNRIKLWEEHDRVTLVFHEKNKGIAASLNEALEFAKKNHKKLLLTMDQDTVLNEDCVANMLSELNKHDNVAAVGPNRKIKIKSTREKSYLITSGCLVVVEKAILAGGYSNNLFIDMVDYDFSLALRSNGYRLLMVGNAYMRHKVGEYEENTILGKKIVYLSHSPKRFYDIYRGRIIILKKYFSRFPTFCIKMLLFTVKETITMQFEANANEKNRNMRAGIKSGLSYKVEKRSSI